MRRLFTSLPTSTMPHSSVSSTSYSCRGLRFCAISRSLSCSRSGASFFPPFDLGFLAVALVLLIAFVVGRLVD